MALKVIDLESADGQLDALQMEVRFLAQTRCPQLIHFHEAHVVGDKLWCVPHSPCCVRSCQQRLLWSDRVITEFLSGGSVLDLIESG